jgi:hypothetical protein
VLCLGASVFLFWMLFSTIVPSLTPNAWRLLMMAVNLFILALTCLTIVRLYHLRERMPQSEGGLFPRRGWKSPVGSILMWMALPLCGLALSVFIPPTTDAYGFVFPGTMLAGLELIGARFFVQASSREMRSPGAG